MIFLGFLVVICISLNLVEAEIKADTIGDFNIGQLFAFYKTDGLCQARYQFVVAKKADTGKCQWKAEDEFKKKEASKDDLPIEDLNKNCYFSCVPNTGSKRWHAEKIVNRYLKEQGITRSDFDIYTYLAPCKSCVEGSDTQDGGTEKADFDKYKAVFYSFKPNQDDTVGTVVKNDDLLEKDSKHGLESIKLTTTVDMDEVKSKVLKGKDDEKKADEILAAIERKFLKNAVESYLKQHPLK